MPNQFDRRLEELATAFPKWAELAGELVEAVADLGHLQPAIPKQRLPFHEAAPGWMRLAILAAADRGCSAEQIAQTFKARGIVISDALIAKSLRAWRGESLELEPIDLAQLDSEDKKELAQAPNSRPAKPRVIFYANSSGSPPATGQNSARNCWR